MTLNLAGMRFGKLSVIERQGTEVIVSRNNKRKVSTSWSCVCDCGNHKIINAKKLNGGQARSCGCVFSGTHKESRGTKEYIAWCSMKRRCNYVNGKRYPDYGGRGIKVCERWQNSFENFLSDMGRAPSSAHSLDRFPDNNGNYEPGNVRWATPEEQAKNRRSNVTVEYDGRVLTISEWSKIIGWTFRTIRIKVGQGRSIGEIMNEKKERDLRRLQKS